MRRNERTSVDGADGRQVVEIHLEELGQHSWLAALANTLTGTLGSAQFRFVARRSGAPDDPEAHVCVGATFPVMRFQDMDNQTEPNAWSDLARDRLAELDAELLSQGWRRLPERGRHWWSSVYERGVRPSAG